MNGENADVWRLHADTLVEMHMHGQNDGQEVEKQIIRITALSPNPRPLKTSEDHCGPLWRGH